MKKTFLTMICFGLYLCSIQTFASSVCFSSSHDNATSATINCGSSGTYICDSSAACQAYCTSGNLTEAKWIRSQVYQNENSTSWTVQVRDVNNYKASCSVSYN
jgi:hypothetical protein